MKKAKTEKAMADKHGLCECGQGEWTAGHDGMGKWGIYHGNETRKDWSGKGRLLVDGLSESQAKAVEQVHNAALTAERERMSKKWHWHEHWQKVAEAHDCQNLTDTFVQLTQLRDRLAVRQQHIGNLDKALAAEREKGERNFEQSANDSYAWKQKWEQLREQLAAAQAAIADHNDVCGDLCDYRIPQSDRTALDAAIAAAVEKEAEKRADWNVVIEDLEAEVKKWKEAAEIERQRKEYWFAAQKPLVDALKEQQELWALAAVQLNASDDKAHRVKFMEFHKPLGKISAALAKVKEGKS